MDNNPVAIAIREVLTAIRQRKRVEEILEMVLSYSSELGNAAHGSIVTIDHNAQKLIITSVRGDDWTLEKQMCQLGLGEGLTGHVALTGKPYLCSDTNVDPNYFPLFDNVQCELIVPIIVEERGLGPDQPRRPHARHLRRLDPFDHRLASRACLLRDQAPPRPD